MSEVQKWPEFANIPSLEELAKSADLAQKNPHAFANAIQEDPKTSPLLEKTIDNLPTAREGKSNMSEMETYFGVTKGAFKPLNEWLEQTWLKLGLSGFLEQQKTLVESLPWLSSSEKAILAGVIWKEVLKMGTDIEGLSNGNKWDANSAFSEHMDFVKNKLIPSIQWFTKVRNGDISLRKVQSFSSDADEIRKEHKVYNNIGALLSGKITDYTALQRLWNTGLFDATHSDSAMRDHHEEEMLHKSWIDGQKDISLLSEKEQAIQADATVKYLIATVFQCINPISGFSIDAANVVSSQDATLLFIKKYCGVPEDFVMEKHWYDYALSAVGALWVTLWAGEVLKSTKAGVLMAKLSKIPWVTSDLIVNTMKTMGRDFHIPDNILLPLMQPLHFVDPKMEHFSKEAVNTQAPGTGTIAPDKITRAGARSGISHETVMHNAGLPDAERLALAEQLVGKELNQTQKDTILRLHNDVSKGVYQNGHAELRTMVEELDKVGISRDETRELMGNGVLGSAPKTLWDIESMSDMIVLLKQKFPKLQELQDSEIEWFLTPENIPKIETKIPGFTEKLEKVKQPPENIPATHKIDYSHEYEPFAEYDPNTYHEDIRTIDAKLTTLSKDKQTAADNVSYYGKYLPEMQSYYDGALVKMQESEGRIQHLEGLKEDLQQKHTDYTNNLKSPKEPENTTDSNSTEPKAKTESTPEFQAEKGIQSEWKPETTWTYDRERHELMSRYNEEIAAVENEIKELGRAHVHGRVNIDDYASQANALNKKLRDLKRAKIRDQDPERESMLKSARDFAERRRSPEYIARLESELAKKEQELADLEGRVRIDSGNLRVSRSRIENGLSDNVRYEGWMTQWQAYSNAAAGNADLRRTSEPMIDALKQQIRSLQMDLDRAKGV